MSQTKTKEKKATKKPPESEQHQPETMEDLYEMLKGLPGEVNRLLAQVDQIGAEVKDIDKRQKRNLKDAAREFAEEQQLAVLAEEETRKKKQEEEEADMGRFARGVRKVGRLLPDNKRERYMFLGGYMLGTSTSSVVAPIAVLGAAVAKGRVVIGR